ncbi:hypothetical protein G6F22_014317 [Rhizopus arrhizus]|nr:hypothetical protein G6F22_014317 [Rhizopus arrhizus]
MHLHLAGRKDKGDGRRGHQVVDADRRGDGQAQIAVPRFDGGVRLVEGQMLAAGVAEVQHPAQQRLHRAVVQQGLGPLARQPRIHPAQGQQAQPAHAGADQTGRVGPVDHVSVQRRPQAPDAPHPQVGPVGAAGQRGGVDRAGGRAADDVEGNRAPGMPAARAPPPVRTRPVGVRGHAGPAGLTSTWRVDIDHSHRGHIDDAAHGRAGGQDVHRRIRAQQERTHRHVAAGRRLEQVVGDVASVHVRAHQQVRFALQGGRRQDAHAQRFVQRAVAVHFAIDLKLGRLFTHDFQGAAHLGARGRAARSEVRPR